MNEFAPDTAESLEIETEDWLWSLPTAEEIEAVLRELDAQVGVL